MRPGMEAKIVLLYSLLILFAMQLGGVYLVNALENYHLRNFTAGQNSQAELLGNFLRRYLLEDEQQPELISGLISDFWEGSPVTEIMVLDRHGRLLGGPDQRSVSLLGGRVIQDDILLALTGNRVETIRADSQTGGRHHYLALPVKDGATVVGVVFLRSSLEHIYITLREIKFMLISGWLVVLAISIVIGFLLTRTITRPIREVTSRAAAMARGDFSQQITVRSQDEIGELGQMFNYLASRLQDTLQAMSEEKNKQQEFVANVSHELRTPLTTIKNYVETLLSGAQEKPAVRTRFLQVLETETDRMVKLIKDLLILSRLDSREENQQKESVELSAFVQSVLAQVQLEGKLREIELGTVIPEEKINVMMERDRILQVLLILLDNALKYTPPGGHIELSAAVNEDRILITVSDTGMGIPENEIGRVFERFYRVDKARSRDSGGTGLGLSIARQLVESHGGTITLESTLKEGTVVTISLPLEKEERLAEKEEKNLNPGQGREGIEGAL